MGARHTAMSRLVLTKACKACKACKQLSEIEKALDIEAFDESAGTKIAVCIDFERMIQFIALLCARPWVPV